MRRRTGWVDGLVMHCLWLCAIGNFAAAQESTLILAHRGGMAEFEENTMQGFQNCYEKGIRGFETDLRMTKDGELVILHDDTLDRTHRASGSVENMSAEQLRGIVTNGLGQRMLFLDELLDYFADKQGVYLELEMKCRNRDLYSDERLEEFSRKLFEVTRARCPEGSTYVISSFDDRPLRIIHRLNAEAPLCFITSQPCTSEFIQKAVEIGANRIACKMEGVSRAIIEEAQERGLVVNGWPGHRLQDYYLALGLGVDIHCTDIPLEVLAQRQRITTP